MIAQAVLAQLVEILATEELNLSRTEGVVESEITKPYRRGPTASQGGATLNESTT